MLCNKRLKTEFGYVPKKTSLEAFMAFKAARAGRSAGHCHERHRLPSAGLTLARALCVVLIWGLNFVVMKLGLQGLSPMLLGALRFAAASLPLLLFVPGRRCPGATSRPTGSAQALGQFGLLFLGLQLGMTAGMASVVMQTQAFFTLLLAGPLLGERARATSGSASAVALGACW